MSLHVLDMVGHITFIITICLSISSVCTSFSSFMNASNHVSVCVYNRDRERTSKNICSIHPVITGATDGIGKRYAEILASKGMHIVLLSRSEPKLMKVAEEILTKYNVETRWVAVDFSKGPEIYQMIREKIEGLDIGILVNNVGYYPEVRSFDRNTEDEIISTININILSTTMMTRIVLPGMKQRRRGIIVNISSIGCYRPAAFLNMYASAKAFVTNFSLALNHELIGKGVKCQAVVPGMTHTNMIKHLEEDIPWYVGVTTVDSLAKFGIFSLGKTAHTTGGWKHTLQVL
ncbi:inactive hydroxysteroid dehydrogenase-like protein 1 [Aedes albopictus]|uniref:17 beta-hydroxysteroid dehydrogenase type 3 n=1 Tax=Aedes albopictus TaxID=7160 RepID=A0ABM1Z3A0_AEDAL